MPQIRIASFAQVANGLVGESVETTGDDILLELLVPGGGNETEKPVAEGGQISAREFLDGVLNLKNGARVRRIRPVDFRSSAEPNRAYLDKLAGQ